jgi:succinate dehydrogenase / fumarate reductase, iron-sulfur subunit
MHRMRGVRRGLPSCLGSALPRGQPERDQRVARMVAQMDAESFGNCAWYGECQAACPKRISIDVIARMNREYLRASMTRSPGGGGSS